MVQSYIHHPNIPYWLPVNINSKLTSGSFKYLPGEILKAWKHSKIWITWHLDQERREQRISIAYPEPTFSCSEKIAPKKWRISFPLSKDSLNSYCILSQKMSTSILQLVPWPMKVAKTQPWRLQSKLQKMACAFCSNLGTAFNFPFSHFLGKVYSVCCPSLKVSECYWNQCSKEYRA